MEASGSSVHDSQKITSWHAVVFFQGFMVLFSAAVGVWYFVVATSPGSVTEYLPRETAADFDTIAGSFILALIWLMLAFLTWKGKKAGSLGSAVFGLLNLVIIIVAFASGIIPAPAFRQFLIIPVLVFGTAASFSAWRSLKQD